MASHLKHVFALLHFILHDVSLYPIKSDILEIYMHKNNQNETIAKKLCCFNFTSIFYMKPSDETDKKKQNSKIIKCTEHSAT